MPLGTLFSEASALFRRHSSLFMGLAAIQVVPALLLALVLQATGIGPRGIAQVDAIMQKLQQEIDRSGGQDPNVLIGMPWGLPTDHFATLVVWSMTGIFVQYFLFRTISLAAMVVAVGDAYQNEQPSWRRVLAATLPHLPALLGWALLSGVLLLGSIFLLLIPCLGLFIWLSLIIFLSIRLLLVPQVVVAERTGLFQALGRSWELTKGTFWRAFGAVMIFVVVLSLISLIVTSLLGAIALAMFGESSGVTIAVQQGVSTVASLLTTPLAYIGFTLLYYDYQLQASQPAPPSQPLYPPYQ
ncbi:MAG TPA: glycerophosphoryl diester phosphodiesterase membrane domain-containing protein [Herpetosiphonaceae bacterium]